MRKHALTTFIGVGIFVAFLLPLTVTAAVLTDYTAQDMIDILENVGNWIFAVALLIGVVMMIVGAAFVLTGGSDPTKLAKGKTTLIWGVVGLAVALLSKGIFTVVQKIIGT